MKAFLCARLLPICPLLWRLGLPGLLRHSSLQLPRCSDPNSPGLPWLPGFR